jgi:OmpA-OmpF porin, OOP family
MSSKRKTKVRYGQRVCAVAVVLLLVFPGASAPVPTTDVKGSKDHPLLSRYPGAIIIDYRTKEYDEDVLALGRALNPHAPGPTPRLAKSIRVEGAYTRILYLIPPGTSTLQVVRNYEQALKKEGFVSLFHCGDAECGPENAIWFSSALAEAYRDGYGNSPVSLLRDSQRSQRYFAAQLPREQGDVHLTLYIAENSKIDQAYGKGALLADVHLVEGKSMQTGMVTVHAAQMASEIAQSGHVALYGIFFDSNKAEIKPKSEPTLQEIAKYLKSDRNLKLLVVGHTDSVGGFEFNRDLSQRRAKAVVEVLVGKHSIAASRLFPYGVSFAAPVAPNMTEEGRAKNRRVELVRFE